MYIAIMSIFSVVVWLWWKKPFFTNFKRLITHFIVGNKGVTIRLLDNDMNETEICGKVENSDGIMVDHERYVIVPQSSIKQRTKTNLKYVANWEIIEKNKGKNVIEEVIHTAKDFEFYKVDKNAVKTRNWGQDVIFTYLQGYPLPLQYDFKKHIKVNTVSNYVITSNDLNKFMKKKIFSDKVYDDASMKVIQWTAFAILFGVVIIGIILIKSVFFPTPVGG